MKALPTIGHRAGPGGSGSIVSVDIDSLGGSESIATKRGYP